MKLPVRCSLGILVASAVIAAAPALAVEPDLIQQIPPPKLADVRLWQEIARRAESPLASQHPADTVWVGHSHTDHSGPQNPWNVYRGTYTPGTNVAGTAVWDFDDNTGFAIAPAESLQGWMAIRRRYQITGGFVMSDFDRTGWGLDYGNQANYVRNTGSANKRTFGVDGVWHRDSGAPPGGVPWAPIAGVASAWCGLRAHGDNTVIDAGTGNPFNQTVLEYNGEDGVGTGTTKNFPGYASQWDQMLYRDVVVTPHAALPVAFSYRTRMSTKADLNPNTRTGWFFWDPLNTAAPNFESSTLAGAAPPIDMLDVYIGSPVNDAACLYTDGSVRPVYDPKHRWLSEVIRLDDDAPAFRLLRATGNTPAGAGPAFYAAVLAPATVDAVLGAPGNPGTIRFVFRVKTNRGWADDDFGQLLYTSAGEGAALIDDVTIGGVIVGDFEAPSGSGPNTIDNRTTVSAVTNWKSTGKPPDAYPHADPLSTLAYADDVAPEENTACRMRGTVVSFGNHAQGESAGDQDVIANRERADAIVSPAINLVAGAAANSMGLTAAHIAVPSNGDWLVAYDTYTGVTDLPFTCNAWVVGAQCYPARQANGLPCWGELRFAHHQMYWPRADCFTAYERLFSNGLIVSANAGTPVNGGYPDSIRIAVSKVQQCFRFGCTLSCNSTAGMYVDNLALGFVKPHVAPCATTFVSATPVPPGAVGSISADPWFWLQDAFPTNETVGLAGLPGFDVTTARVQTGLNIAQSTGNASRFDRSADSLVARANGPDTRVDLVFRILPGLGNYAPVPARCFPPTPAMVLLKDPAVPGVPVVPGDLSFWGQLLATPGPFATPGAHFGGVSWDPLSWNSVRCDSADKNLFPILDRGVALMTPGLWASTIHEADPRFLTLGQFKPKCFLINPLGAEVQANITCVGVAPAWALPIVTGYDGVPVTKEFTKIIPDALLTPGSHVQYFLRRSRASDPTKFVLTPDTCRVFPQYNDGPSQDGHRWQSFSVLPDRWKDPAFCGTGMACMLVVDIGDRFGDERVWMSVMDSLGGTLPARRGAHNGWRARGDQDYFEQDLTQMPSIAIHGRNQQAGSSFDLYNVRGGESPGSVSGRLGSRLANRVLPGLLANQWSLNGPTPEMLRVYYQGVYQLSADLEDFVLAPQQNDSQDDVSLITDFMTGGGGSPMPRFVASQGSAYATSEVKASDPAHLALLTTRMGLTLRDPSYPVFAGTIPSSTCSDLLPTPPFTSGAIYGASMHFDHPADVLQANPAIAEAMPPESYEPVGGLWPYTAAVYKPPVAIRNWSAWTTGYGIQDVFSRQCLTSFGRLANMYEVLGTALALPCQLTGAPAQTIDVPDGSGAALVSAYLAVRGNPVRGPDATLEFGLPDVDRVVVEIFDVAGRRLRRLADRTFTAGRHELVWDGRTDEGALLPRGVYLTRIRFASRGWEKTEKLTLLR